MDGEQTMVGFGPKQAWLAVREDAVGEVPDASVLAALELRDLGPVSWRSGVDLAYLTDDRVVLTPPLPGAGGASWLLLVGRWLLRDEPVDLATRCVTMSAMLDTEVQSFATYRVHEVHRWARAVSGRLVRAFGFLGETGEVTDWRGDADASELELGLPATLPSGPQARAPELLVSEKEVLRLAGAWSVDPTGLDGRQVSGPLRAAAAP
jgi:hypothetical protein